jgi:hypothetical protein
MSLEAKKLKNNAKSRYAFICVTAHANEMKFSEEIPLPPLKSQAYYQTKRRKIINKLFTKIFLPKKIFLNKGFFFFQRIYI